MMVDGYRVAGTTDDVTTCDQCGREDLRMTVRLVIVKGDVEDGELFVGSECATRFPAPGRKRRTRSAILAEAAAADRERAERHKKAREMIAYYAPEGRITMESVRNYMAANPGTDYTELVATTGLKMRQLLEIRLLEWYATLAS